MQEISEFIGENLTLTTPPAAAAPPMNVFSLPLSLSWNSFNHKNCFRNEFFLSPLCFLPHLPHKMMIRTHLAVARFLTHKHTHTHEVFKINFLLFSFSIHVQGAIFREDQRDSFYDLAFKFAIHKINKDPRILPKSLLTYDIQYVDKDDSFHANKQGSYE
jgi:hypothetical protein